jgi:potassium-transporting ATPase KdpC subunit
VLFPRQATGSLVTVDGQARGSELVAQPFNDDRYFQARPSAANYDPMSAAGSNQARSNPELRKRVGQSIAAVAVREGIAPADVPGELVTQSGSGMDPHLSPSAALVQADRVARARGFPPSAVVNLIHVHTQAPQFGVLGPPRVNVLRLNLALDALGQAE